MKLHPDLQVTINRRAHSLAQASYSNVRMALELMARDLLRRGVSMPEIEAALVEADPIRQPQSR